MWWIWIPRRLCSTIGFSVIISSFNKFSLRSETKKIRRREEREVETGSLSAYGDFNLKFPNKGIPAWAGSARQAAEIEFRWISSPAHLSTAMFKTKKRKQSGKASHSISSRRRQERKKNVIKINCTAGINIGKFLRLHTSFASPLYAARAALAFLFRTEMARNYLWRLIFQKFMIAISGGKPRSHPDDGGVIIISEL